MARLRGRARVILEEARQRMDKARLEYKAAQHEAERAQIVFEAHADAYDSLMRALEPTPRQPSKPTVGATPTRVYERCAQCGKTKGHRFHKDSSEDGYHQFQSPSPTIIENGFDISALCRKCAHREEHEDHSQPSPNYHQFVPSLVDHDTQAVAGGA